MRTSLHKSVTGKNAALRQLLQYSISISARVMLHLQWRRYPKQPDERAATCDSGTDLTATDARPNKLSSLLGMVPGARESNEDPGRQGLRAHPDLHEVTWPRACAL